MVARPKRETEWAPLTARLDLDASRRLKVAAAKRGMTQGRILDELILANLPPVDPAPAPKRGVAHPERGGVTAEWLRAEMHRLGVSQASLAEALTITQKSISEWFARGAVPTARHGGIRAHLAAVRQAKAKRGR